MTNTGVIANMAMIAITAMRTTGEEKACETPNNLRLDWSVTRVVP
jgi:hypothetical protein